MVTVMAVHRYRLLVLNEVVHLLISDDENPVKPQLIMFLVFERSFKQSNILLPTESFARLLLIDFLLLDLSCIIL